MATQAFIIEQENTIIEAEKAIKSLNKALQGEKDDKWGNHTSNADCWGTTLLNIRSLCIACKQFLAKHGG